MHSLKTDSGSVFVIPLVLWRIPLDLVSRNPRDEVKEWIVPMGRRRANQAVVGSEGGRRPVFGFRGWEVRLCEGPPCWHF
jgi:hypothetical protein